MRRLLQTRVAAALALLLAAGLASCGDTPLGHTIVRFDTALGSFEVQLYDDVTPKTVENFLGYVQPGDYDDSIVHRSVPGFVIQGGGFTPGPVATFPETFPGRVPIHRPVQNEAALSNVRGTIAMALEYADDHPLINSATNEWYINLADNSRLDADKFTVFGHVRGDGMKVVDAIAALEIYDLSTYNDALNTTPLTAPPTPLRVEDLVTLLRVEVVSGG